MRLMWAVAVLALHATGCRSRDNQVREETSHGMEREIVAATRTIGPYSPAVRVGDFLFVSGQIGMDQETGRLRNETIEAETQQVLANINALLQAAGYDSSDVVSATVYLTDIGNFQRMNGVYGRFFPAGNYPARQTVAVHELPGRANIEIAVVACRTKR
jgi:2-iminobutanoate/2-iminopropanoate deaminase